MRLPLNFLVACIVGALLASAASAQRGTWHFAVSGDSRNCGDIVMPAVAKSAHARDIAFYWHLGDFRAIYRFDQDYAEAHKPIKPNDALAITDYLGGAWQDFIENQLQAFEPTPVFLAFGNHETIPPKTKEQAIAQFADWLDSPVIRQQRLQDDPHDHLVKGYFHWVTDGIDFITLENAAGDAFDSTQMNWLQALLKRDETNFSIRALVIGMHEALPESIAADHSMNQSPLGVQTGQMVYGWLLQFKLNFNKQVYILASHSHYYMDGIFNTEYWHNHGGVLPGWIIGTAGAERYELPPNAWEARSSRAHVYGYLLATVTQFRDDPVHFEFKELAEVEVPPNVVSKYSAPVVHDCWANNPVR